MRRASQAFAFALCLTLLQGTLAAAAEVVPPPLLETILGQDEEPPADEAAPSAAAEPEAATEPAASEPLPPAPLVIGAAPVAGTFFPTAGAICRAVNRQQAENGLRCLVEESEGSAANLQQLRDGTLDVAIVQSDWAYHALNGSTSDRAPPLTNLYSLVILQPQMMTLVVGGGSGVESVEDLAGKRVSIGPSDSSLNIAARNLLQMAGLTSKVTTVDLPVEKQVKALCENDIDAFLLPVVHPSGLVEAAVAACGARLVSLNGSRIDELIATWPFYVRALLPAGLYPGQEQEVRSYGTVGTLITTDRLSDEAAYGIVKAIFEGFDDMQAQHPSLALLLPEGMIGPAGMAAPLHPGALRYYAERGWR